jgi:hypothetical protein
MKLLHLKEDVCSTAPNTKIAPQSIDLIVDLAIELNSSSKLQATANYWGMSLAEVLNHHVGVGIVSRSVLELSITLAAFFRLHAGSKNKVVLRGYLNDKLNGVNSSLRGRDLLIDVEKTVKDELKGAKSVIRKMNKKPPTY